MTLRPLHHRTLGYLASTGIVLGGGLTLAGAGLALAAPLLGWTPPLLGGQAMADAVAGTLVGALGVGLVLRGAGLHVALTTLAAVQGAAPQASVPVPAPAPRWEPVRVDTSTAAPMGDVHLAKPRVVASSAVPQGRGHSPVTAKGAAQSGAQAARPTQSDVRPSRDAPIKGKPFQPNQIFMARPPR